MPLARACREAGGQALVVGGAVRDLMMARMGIPSRRADPIANRPTWSAPIDLDVEVHRLAPAVLEKILRRFGSVNLVGQAFAVYKLGSGGSTVDVSLPRRDNRSGRGHRGFVVECDPYMGVEEAARRRDLTLNALALDVLERVVLDPFHGERDIRDRTLRVVDRTTFVEDPLRALRVLRFAARLDFDVDGELWDLCRTMPLDDLPPERVRDEVRKTLVHAIRPSRGIVLGLKTGAWIRVMPSMEGVDASRTGRAVDAVMDLADRYLRAGSAAEPELDVPRATALAFACLLHELDPSKRTEVLDRLDLHTLGGFPLRRTILFVAAHAGGVLPAASDGSLRLLARDAEPFGGLILLLLAASALWGDPAFEELIRRAEALGVLQGPPPRLLHGRDLEAAGLPPGPEMGALLEGLYVLQLERGITRTEELWSSIAELGFPALRPPVKNE
jgi:tRNA nucleotidyltransferase (CCA-adding enzyme)